jgi:hypothetical protein
VVALELGDVVGDVVDLTCALGHPRPEDPRHRLSHAVGEHRTVTPREVRRTDHRGQVALPLGGTQRCAGKLAVRKGDPVTGQYRVHQAHVVGAHLMSESPRTGVDQHRHLIHAEAEALGCLRIEDFGDALSLEEVVARAEGAELIGPAHPRALGHRRGIGVGQAPPRLGVLDVLLAPDSVRRQ